MARLNIEDEFMMEVTAVAATKGVDPDKLAGNAIRWFRYAQEKHRLGKRVSEEEFKTLGFMEELFPLFSKRTEAGIEAAGSKRFFGWLEKKSEAGSLGGKRSAEVRKTKYGSAQPKHVEAPPKQDRSEIKHAEASSSYSLSSSIEELNTVSTEVSSDSIPWSYKDETQIEIAPTEQSESSPAVARPTRRKRQELFKPESIEELRAAFDGETRKVWAELYPDSEFRKRESLKCWDYYRDAGAKRPTTLAGWKRVMGSWFARGWSKHAGGLPHHGPGPQKGPFPIRYPSVDQVFADQEAARKSHQAEPEPEINVEELHPAVRGALQNIKGVGA